MSKKPASTTNAKATATNAKADKPTTPAKGNEPVKVTDMKVTAQQLRVMRWLNKGQPGTAHTRASLKAATGLQKGYSKLLTTGQTSLEKQGYVTTTTEGRIMLHILTPKGRKYVADHATDVLVLHTLGESGQAEKGVTVTPVVRSEPAASEPTVKATSPKVKATKPTTPAKGDKPTKVKATKPAKVTA